MGMKKVYLLLVMAIFCSYSFAQGQKKASRPDFINQQVTQIERTPEVKKALLNSFASNVISEQVTAKELVPMSQLNLGTPTLKAPSAAISVYYPRPLGTYIGGFTDYDGTYYPSLIGPSNYEMEFIALASNYEGTTFGWYINNNLIDERIDEYGDLYFKRDQPGTYYMVELRGQNGTNTASYKYAGHLSGQFLDLSSPEETPMTNADIAFKFDDASGNLFGGWSATEYFGTGYVSNGVPCDGVVALFQAPISPLYVPSIEAFVTTLESGKPIIPAGKSLTCSVYYLTAEGQIDTDNLIGSSTITAEDLRSGEFSDVLHFTFYEEDDLGIITEAPLTLAESFVVIITGVDECNIRFIISSHQDTWGGSAYTLHKGALSSITYTDGSNAIDLNIQLNAIYNCLVVDESTSELTAPVDGGYLEWYSEEDQKSYNNIYVTSSFGADEVWVEDCPSWIGGFEADSDYFADYNVLFLYAQAEALPAGTDGRTGYITFASYGVTAKVKVTQGTGGVNIENVDSEEFSVVRNGDDFTLTYPSAATSVSLYNIAGQKVAEYNLNASGSFLMPAANLLNGTYILRFNGINESVKIIK